MKSYGKRPQWSGKERHEPMQATTFSLYYEVPRRSFVDTATESIQSIREMSTQAKARLELLALVVGLVLSVTASAKVWFILPEKVDRQEKAITELQIRRESDREILMKLVWQNDRIVSDISDIKAAVKKP